MATPKHENPKNYPKVILSRGSISAAMTNKQVAAFGLQDPCDNTAYFVPLICPTTLLSTNLAEIQLCSELMQTNYAVSARSPIMLYL